MAAEVNNSDLVGLVSHLQAACNSPESYFQPSKQLPKDTINRLKLLFDFSRQSDPTKESISCPLSQLMVEGFDDEQIWQQIELQNDPVVSGIRKQVKHLKASGDALELLPKILEIDNGHNSEDERNVEFDDSNDDSDADDKVDDINSRVLMPASSSEDEEDENEDNVNNNESDNNQVQLDAKKKPGSARKATSSANQKGKKKGKNRGSIVDDKFFKLSEMTEFLNKMDQQFERSRDGKKKTDDDDGDIDLFRNISSGDDDDDDEDDGDDWGNVLGNTAKIMGRDVKESKTLKSKTTTELKYSDYFDPPDNVKQNMDIEEEMSEDDDDDDDNDDNDDFEGDEDDLMEDDDEDESDDELMEEDAEENIKDVEINNGEDQILSRHEKEKGKLIKKIAQLEKENLTKKPWQMSGEAGSTARPMNSLLEEDLNFDHTTAVAPPITEETTKDLEDIIRQRIKDEAWDDVERKQKPVTQPYEYKKKRPLDQEKSKLSLSQIYEQEYIKQTDVKEGPQEEQENEEHKEIKQLMTKLFTKLDALSNFHFTPKPLKPEVKIVTNTPVISMEEVAPVVASDAMLLAPEETHKKTVELKGDAEKTETDRKRDRRSKKLKQRMKAREKEKRSKIVSKNPGLGNKYAKKKALERIEKEVKTSKNLSLIREDAGEKALKSSSAFFSRLHDEVKQQVESKKVTTEKKKTKTNISNLKL